MRILIFIALVVVVAIVGIRDALASSEPTTNKQVEPYIYVSGGVREPGHYGWTNDMTVLDGIRVAGGFTESAGRKIEIYHFVRFQQTPNGEVEIYGKAEIYDRGNLDVTNQPPILLKGDQIFVSVKARRIF